MTDKQTIVAINNCLKQECGGWQVLSLFDGMACGALALLVAEIEIDRYVAYEIDKYAIQTSSHNLNKGD